MFVFLVVYVKMAKETLVLLFVILRFWMLMVVWMMVCGIIVVLGECYSLHYYYFINRPK